MRVINASDTLDLENKLKSLGLNELEGWLYCFETINYRRNQPNSCSTNVFKVGKTDKNILYRLKQYTDHTNTIQNIYAFECDIPEQRESLLLNLLKNQFKLKVMPNKHEYFETVDNNLLLKTLMMIVQIPSEQVAQCIQGKLSIIMLPTDEQQLAMQIQASQNLLVPTTETKNKCVHCDKCFSSKQSLDRHYGSCKQKQTTTLNEINTLRENMQKEIDSLKTQLVSREQSFQALLAVVKDNLNTNH